jgi:hypothetical protein
VDVQSPKTENGQIAMPDHHKPPTEVVVAIDRFWRWFAENDDRLFHFDRDLKRTFGAVSAALNEVDGDLTFEFGPVDDGRRDFVISAGGIKRAFPAVEALAAAAPPMRRWRVIAFRPRRLVGNTVDFGGIRVDPATVTYSLLASDTKLGVYLYIPGYAEGDTRYGQAGYLLLDEALGEYDVETKLGPIQMFAPEARTDGPRYPLKELPGHFDDVYRRMKARQN